MIQTNKYYRIDSKEYLVLSARVHPSESNSNWIMKGTILYCTVNSKYSLYCIQYLNYITN